MSSHYTIFVSGQRDMTLELPTHWEACSRSDLESLAETGSYAQRLIAHRYLADNPVNPMTGHTYADDARGCRHLPQLDPFSDGP